MSATALRGAQRATVRVHRTALWAGAALVLCAAAVLGSARWAAWAYPEPDRMKCVGPCDPGFFWYSSGETFLSSVTEYAAVALLLVPLLIGAFVAGPLIARELESGTHRLAWTQSLSPARWLAAKLSVAAVVASAGTLALMLLFRLATSLEWGRWNLNWADRGMYEASGPVLLAYSLLAVAVGTLVGLLVHRTLAAASLAALVTGLVLFVIGSVRWDVFPVRTITGSGTHVGLEPFGSFRMRSGYFTSSGGRLPWDACFRRAPDSGKCPADLHITGWFVDYHPHSHYWYVQLLESGIVLALAAAAGYAAFRVLRRRTA
ncbi:ABC transporter permease [Streptomyces sp. NPDC002004]